MGVFINQNISKCFGFRPYLKIQIHNHIIFYIDKTEQWIILTVYVFIYGSVSWVKDKLNSIMCLVKSCIVAWSVQSYFLHQVTAMFLKRIQLTSPSLILGRTSICLYWTTLNLVTKLKDWICSCLLWGFSSLSLATKLKDWICSCLLLGFS